MIYESERRAVCEYAIRMWKAGLVVGSSDRGWPSLGKDSYGLERLTWSGEVPFEISEMLQVASPDFRSIVIS